MTVEIREQLILALLPMISRIVGDIVILFTSRYMMPATIQYTDWRPPSFFKGRRRITTLAIGGTEKMTLVRFRLSPLDMASLPSGMRLMITNVKSASELRRSILT